MSKRALITGVTGQDGSYLAELLLSKGYEVFGTTRVTVTPKTENIKDALSAGLKLLMADLQDSESLSRAVQIAQPDEVYNLGAVSYAPASWHCPAVTMDVNAAGVVRLLEAVRRIKPDARLYQASTSEMFGDTQETAAQDERTAFQPVHPYGAAKVAGHWAARSYREQYGMHVSCGILFNHESPRRGLHFVTHKVTDHVARIACKLTIQRLGLWTLETVRDWGFAGDYVKAMWLMLQQPNPGDYCIGTGHGHTVRDLVQAAFEHANLDWGKWVSVDPPQDFKVDLRSNFIADYSKARKVLGWSPIVYFEELVGMMVEHDLRKYKGR